MTHNQYLAELSRIRISGSVIDDESLTKTEYLERKGEKKSHSISTCMNGGRRLVTQKKCSSSNENFEPSSNEPFKLSISSK